MTLVFQARDAVNACNKNHACMGVQLQNITHPATNQTRLLASFSKVYSVFPLENTPVPAPAPSPSPNKSMSAMNGIPVWETTNVDEEVHGGGFLTLPNRYQQREQLNHILDQTLFSFSSFASPSSESATNWWSEQRERPFAKYDNLPQVVSYLRGPDMSKFVACMMGKGLHLQI